MRMMKHYLVGLLAALSLAGCLSVARPPSTQPAPTAEQLAQWTATCTAIWREELDRPIDPGGLEGCIEQAKAGGTAETIRAEVQKSDEYKNRLAELERQRKEAEEREKLKNALRGRLDEQGLDFVDAQGRKYIPIWASELSILMKSEAEWEVIFDLLKSKNYNGFRVFAGHLGWSEFTQTLDIVREKLGKLLDAAARRGLYAMVTAITDSGVGYDIRQHLIWVRDITRLRENVVLEAFNEPYHGTQSALVNNYAAACALAREVLADYPNPWAFGTGSEDTAVNGAYSGDCGTFNTVHPWRGGSYEEMLGRFGGAEAIRRATGKPVINSEMIGADEVDRPGRRIGNPEFFERAARLCNSYGYGCVFHSEDGLFARPWGPRQDQAATAFANAFTLPPDPLPGPVNPDACANADINTHEEVVECQREKYGTPLSSTQLADLMVAIAKHLNTLGLGPGDFGVLIKEGGNNCTATTGEVISCDIICVGQGGQQRQWDVLTAQEAQASPVWHEVQRPGLVERPCKVVR